MPNAALSAKVFINAEPETVFVYVADLTKHGEWSANPLKVEAIANDPIAIGKQYRSSATVGSLTFAADLRVTEYDPPARFGFEGQDSTGKFLHRFTFTPLTNGTQVTRHIDFTLSFRQWLRFWILYFPVRRPAAIKALQLLKEKLNRFR
jgi:uncharacterized protein YndB with AHSA1/START domain